MIESAKGDAFDLAIVRKPDRFSRRRCAGACCKRELRKHGVSMMRIPENRDDSPESLIPESVRMVFLAVADSIDCSEVPTRLSGADCLESRA